MTVHRVFLPWVRTGLVGAITRTAAAGAPARAEVPITARVNSGTAVTVPVVLNGPGDVTTLDPSRVLRTVPEHDAGAAEPTFLAAVDLDEPDAPWAFTPLAADGERLDPWLVLAVVERGTSTLTRADGRPPVLDCAVAELPDLDESWAWAHAQVIVDDPGENLVATVTDKPERTVSRLLCPRRLHAGVAYRACVVPAFETGRRRGLGEVPAPGALLARAWNVAAGGRTQLPVLYYWEFTTGDGLPFEELADALQPWLPVDLPMREVNVGSPGWGLADGPADLVAVRSALGGDTDDAWAGVDAWADRLRGVLTAGPDAPDVRPPVYGAAAAGVTEVGDGAPRWLRELNLDPRLRIVAGLGARLVRLQQEWLVAEAWARLRMVTAPAGPDDGAPAAPGPAGSASAAAAQLSAAVSRAVLDRHVVPLGTSTFLQITAPMDPMSSRLRPGAMRMVRRGGLGQDGGRFERIQRNLAVRAVTRSAAPEPPSAVPRIPVPVVEWLRDIDPDALLPGSDEIPDDTVALLAADTVFAEALLVGINDELSRELRWRGLPVRPGGTYLNRFWTRPGADTDDPELPDIDGWDADSALGTHLRVPEQGLMVLLLRGELLRRFPRTRISVARAIRTPEGREPGEETRPEVFRLRWGRGATLVGLPLSDNDARGGPGDEGWFIVLEEPAEEPRFGLDPSGSFGGEPASWDELSWGHLVADAADLEALVHVPVGGRLAGVQLDQVTWGTDASAMAWVTEQVPSMVAVHAAVWLGE